MSNKASEWTLSMSNSEIPLNPTAMDYKSMYWQVIGVAQEKPENIEEQESYFPLKIGKAKKIKGYIK